VHYFGGYFCRKGGPRRRWKDIDVDDEELGWEGFEWINVVQDMSCGEHIDELLGVIKWDEEMVALMKGSAPSS